MNYGVAQNDVQKVVQNDVPTLEEQIIQLILKNKQITRKKMASIVGKSIETIERTICESKKIKYVGSKAGHLEKIQ